MGALVDLVATRGDLVDASLAASAAGQKIVLLGAGFDARPQRLAALTDRSWLPVDSGGVLRMRHELLPPLPSGHFLD